MPLKFEEPEQNEDKQPKRAVKKETAPSSSSSDKDKKKKGTHRRVFTHSSYYFAEASITIIEAKNLTGKKSAAPFCRIYIGSQIFNTATKKKTLNPTFNETFTSKVDRDDWLQIRVYDHAKLERQLENNEVEPMGKKKIPIKDLARNDTGNETLQLTGGGELLISYQIKINQPKVGTIHTKFFNYPTWMNDKYGVNVQQPDFEQQKIAVATLTRYAMRWLRNQKAIGNLVEQDQDPDSDGEKEKDEVPEGVIFKLLDMSFSCHDKALQLLVTYQWDSKEKNKESDDDHGVSQILQIKVFHADSKLSKKKLNNIKPMLPDLYQKEFRSATSGLDDLFNDVHSWMEEKRDEIGLVFKVAPISTYNSYHVVVWYYR